ncbi:hypothetical protein BGS_0992 [Beggiatoa sp. SS]|nr:hypothetical protein BGS_0992 [Beggiatoa sp. SS]
MRAFSFDYPPAHPNSFSYQLLTIITLQIYIYIYIFDINLAIIDNKNTCLPDSISLISLMYFTFSRFIFQGQ